MWKTGRVTRPCDRSTLGTNRQRRTDLSFQEILHENADVVHNSRDSWQTFVSLNAPVLRCKENQHDLTWSDQSEGRGIIWVAKLLSGHTQMPLKTAEPSISLAGPILAISNIGWWDVSVVDRGYRHWEGRNYALPSLIEAHIGFEIRTKVEQWRITVLRRQPFTSQESHVFRYPRWCSSLSYVNATSCFACHDSKNWMEGILECLRNQSNRVTQWILWLWLEPSN